VRRRRNPRVPLRSSRRKLCPSAFDSSIRPTVHPQSTILCSAPARVVFSSESPALLYLGFLRFSVFPSMQCLPLSSLTFPGGRHPSPSISLWRRPPPPRWRPRPCNRRLSLTPLCSPPLPWLRRRRKKRRKKMVFLKISPCFVLIHTHEFNLI
jgi:hypothetical protein